MIFCIIFKFLCFNSTVNNIYSYIKILIITILTININASISLISNFCFWGCFSRIRLFFWIVIILNKRINALDSFFSVLACTYLSILSNNLPLPLKRAAKITTFSFSANFFQEKFTKNSIFLHCWEICVDLHPKQQ